MGAALGLPEHSPGQRGANCRASTGRVGEQRAKLAPVPLARLSRRLWKERGTRQRLRAGKSHLLRTVFVPDLAGHHNQAVLSLRRLLRSHNRQLRRHRAAFPKSSGAAVCQSHAGRSSHRSECAVQPWGGKPAQQVTAPRAVNR